MSGGKDSTCMALMMLERGEDIAEFIFCDTGMEFPECYDALNRFEEITGRKITRLKSDKTIMYYASEKEIKFRNGVSTKRDGTPKRKHGYGFPSPLRRWCTDNLKLRLLKRYKKEHYPDGCMDCIGIALDEPKRIRENPNKRYPLVEYGITENAALEYCKSRGFYLSPCAYDFIPRVSCFCCPLTNLKTIEYLINKRPELWQRIKEMEKTIGEPWKKLEGRDTDYFERRFTK